MVASEAVPFAKSGGLADVTGALPRALAALGHDVTLVIPRYRGIDVGATTEVARVEVSLGPRTVGGAVLEAPLASGARVWFLDQPEMYDREHLYGKGTEDYGDNAWRFAFLAKAALTAAAQCRLAPDIVHAHDWQAGLVPLYLRTDPGMFPAPPVTVLTIHNLAYQGVFDKSWLPNLGVSWDLFTPDGVEYWDRFSFLKAGINFAEQLTTVSPSYAREIQTAEAGFGFEGVVARRAGALTGILNGIDTARWDPLRDAFLPRAFSAADLSGKQDAKRALLDAFDLPVGQAMKRPLIAMVSRMVDQKGLDLIAQVAPELPHLGATFVVHGTGEARYQDMWRGLAEACPDRIAVKVGYEERLAHLAQAGSDLWLMPSRFEPCGLNQMYSQRYGTLPLVRATGGLDDTVENYDAGTGAGTGFKFQDPHPAALLNTLRWALSVYDDKRAWRRMQVAAMRKDFSWEGAARRHVEVYRRAVATRTLGVAV